MLFRKIASLFLIAQSGSFNPLPVKTQTIVDLFLFYFILISPATEAALAGSQHLLLQAFCRHLKYLRQNRLKIAFAFFLYYLCLISINRVTNLIAVAIVSGSLTIIFLTKRRSLWLNPIIIGNFKFLFFSSLKPINNSYLTRIPHYVNHSGVIPKSSTISKAAVLSLYGKLTGSQELGIFR